MAAEIQERESPVGVWAEFDRAFDAIRRRVGTAWFVEDGPRAPRTDVTDTGKSYKVVAEIPGIPKEKLDVRVRGTSVEIRGEHESATEEKAEQYLHRERTYSGYYRALELPEPVRATEATAKVVDGVLVLELPKQSPTPSEEEVKVAVA